VQAPIIQFDRDARSVVAEGTPDFRASTVFIQTDRKGKQTPVHIVSDHLTYYDNERRAHFTGTVVAKSEDAILTSDQSDVFWLPQGSGTSSQTEAPATNGNQPAGTNKIDKIVADGHVVITQPKRRGIGTHLTYTASDDRFVLVGNPPSIFDAEHGKVTGDSLTFYKRDDRVLVEGKANSPAFTESRVAR
jgi:lipopolysaccharide export system protein LptA